MFAFCLRRVPTGRPSPAIVNGRIYFLTTHDFYCLGKKDQGRRRALTPQPKLLPPRTPNQPICKSLLPMFC